MTFEVISRGPGGIEELAAALPQDDAAVRWGLVQCVIGSGTFARTRYVLVNLMGASCPPLRRMKTAELKPLAVKELGGDAIEFLEGERAKVTLDNLLALLMRVCVADDSGTKSSLASMKADLEAQVKAAQDKFKQPMQPGMPGLAKQSSYMGPRTVVAMGKQISPQACCKYVQEENGPLNWVLLNPKGGLIEAGAGSVTEMRNFLKPTDVAFGLVRRAIEPSAASRRIASVHTVGYVVAGADGLRRRQVPPQLPALRALVGR